MEPAGDLNERPSLYVAGEPASGPILAPAPPIPPKRPSFRIIVVVVVVALSSGALGGLIGRTLLPRVQVPTTSISRSSLQFAGPRLDIASIIAKAEPAVATITADLQQGFTSGSAAGTGVVLTSNGQVATNAHVVEGASSITVTVNGTAHSAVVIGADASADVALLQIRDVSGLPVASLGNSASVQPGDDVVAIGNALGLGGSPSVTSGIVSGINRSIDSANGSLANLIQTDAPISSGNSGGPLLNASGQVIGITTAVITSSRNSAASNVGFAIPINQFMSVVAGLRGSS